MKVDRKLLVLVEHVKNYACLVFRATCSAHLSFVNGEKKILEASVNFGAVVSFSFFTQLKDDCM